MLNNILKEHFNQESSSFSNKNKSWTDKFKKKNGFTSLLVTVTEKLKR